MSIYITGDTHGEVEALLKRKEKIADTLTENDKIIVCGDFGFVFRYDKVNGRYTDEWKLDKLKELFPCEILFISGNHENFDRLYALPDEERYGGTVKKVRNGIYLLKRGEVYEIEGKTFFTFGGAYSVDRPFRTENYTWWPQELPYPEEYQHAIKNLQKYSHIDYIITHTCPQRIIHWMGKSVNTHDAELTGFFDWIFDSDFKQWYFGHWHLDKGFYNDRIIACYENVYCLDETPQTTDN